MGRIHILFLAFLGSVFINAYPQVTYYSQMSGNHNDPIWDVVPVGTPGAAVFNSTNNFIIQTGHTVVLASSPVTLKDLTIQNGAKFYRNSTSESSLRYINLCGNIVCNGDFGNDGVIDAIGVNIQYNPVPHTISGTGKFNALRMRNSDENNDGAVRGNSSTTIAMNVNLRWTGTLPGSGINAIYNNRDAISTFDITINNGCTLTVVEPTAGAGADGPGTGTYSATHRGGVWTVNGVFTINGKLWLGSNNTSNKPLIVIGSNGVMNVGVIDYGADNSNQCAQMTINGGATNGSLNIMGIGGTGSFLNMGVGTTTYNLSNTFAKIEYSGSGAQMVEKNINYQRLIISNIGVRSLVGNTNVIFQLLLNNGELDLNGYSLSIHAAAITSITRIGGYVKSELTNNTSKLKWFMGATAGARIFPFGVNNSTYIPLTYNLTSGNVDTVVISTYGTPPTNLPWPTLPQSVLNLNSLMGLLPDNRDATVDRFWQIGKSNGTGISSIATITFTYAPSELPIPPYNVPTDMRAQRYHKGTNKWQTPLPGQTTGANTVTVPGITSTQLVSYPWSIASVLSPLPVELISFEAVAEASLVKLNWVTQTEHNSSHFIIEKTADFEKIYDAGIVSASGYSSELKNYTFYDKYPINGNAYYRLKQVDFDGKTSYSDWVSVNLSSPVTTANAFVHNKQVHLLFADNKNADYNIDIFDVQGRLIYATPLKSSKQTVVLENLELNPGQLYFLSITGESETKTFKLFGN